jgi:Rps23 Pro-64 3,4-dihydroxylase Tpa1-like proline 4-hydroxylase
MIGLDRRYLESSLQEALRAQYLQAKPFQYLLLDDVFDLETVRAVAAEYPMARHNAKFDDLTSRLKFTCDDWDAFPPRTLELVAFLNCGTFMKFLVAVTGIAELTSDPYLFGGGMHETFPGGFLKMHTDFNFHRTLKLDRRINVLLFLNEGWRPEWKGELLLAERNLKNPIPVAPLINRMVIFNTNDHSFHGQPDPNCFPEGNSRKSIAMYYYSPGRPAGEISSRKYGTSWRARHAGDLPWSKRLRELRARLFGHKRAK